MGAITNNCQNLLKHLNKNPSKLLVNTELTSQIKVQNSSTILLPTTFKFQYPWLLSQLLILGIQVTHSRYR